MKHFFSSMLSANGKISSKRVAGMIILAILCWAYIYCTVKNIQLPSATDWFIGLDGILLGLETIVKPFSKTNGNELSE